MFVDPKISLTQRVTDPAGTIRKARVLLDQHLRQDAAYNRQVSKSLYFIGPDVTCLITHEFNQTYIALDQKPPTSLAPAPVKPMPKFVIAGTVTTLDTTIGSPTYSFNTVAPGGMQFWRSENAVSWEPFTPSAGITKAYQFAPLGNALSIFQTTPTEAFAVWSEELNGGAWYWGAAPIDTLGFSAQGTVPIPTAFRGGTIQVLGAAAGGNGSVVLLVQGGTSAGDYIDIRVCWLDLASGQYVFEQSVAQLVAQENLTAAFSNLLIAALYPLGRVGTDAYNPVGLSVSNPNSSGPLQALAFIVNPNISGRNVSLTASIQNPQANTCGFASGPDGGYVVSYMVQNAPAQALILRAFLFSGYANPVLTSQLNIDVAATTGVPPSVASVVGANYYLQWTPEGYAVSFNYLSAAHYDPVLPPVTVFFSEKGILGVVKRPGPTNPLLLGPIYTSQGLLDLLGVGITTSAAQGAEFMVGSPPLPLNWANPSNLFTQNTTANFGTISFFYRGPLLPWLNLY